jgi:hypothetical protein
MYLEWVNKGQRSERVEQVMAKTQATGVEIIAIFSR